MSKDVFTHHRLQFKSHIGFLLAAIGSAVGMGNIWRFSYLCYKNDGVFLMPYFIALFAGAIPLMSLEIALGHKMRGSAPASVVSIDKKWERDVSVKFIAALILLGLLLTTIFEEIAAPYGNYSRLAIILIGRDGIIMTVFVAFFAALSAWKVDPQHMMIELGKN
ncbi:MAG: hypothetical protein V1739_00980 [Candidatus Omnitrophota bacterium]